MRVSEETLNALWGNQDIDWQTGVRETILGTSVHGRARVIGAPRIQLVSSEDQATFRIVFPGTAYSRTTGYNGPAIIHSRAVTDFTATKQIVLEPGEGFRELPTEIGARTQIFIDGIDSARGGLIGRIVRRRATRIEATMHSQATEIVRQKAATRIASALDRTSQERLARMNWVRRLRDVVQVMFRGEQSGEPRYALSTTPRYLQIALGPGNRDSSSDLSRDAQVELPGADTPVSPVELWIHESVAQNRLPAAALDLVRVPATVNDLLQAISATVQVMTGNKLRSGALEELIAQQPVRTRQSGDWSVIAVEVPLETKPRSPTALAQRNPSAQRNSSAQRNPSPSPALPSQTARLADSNSATVTTAATLGPSHESSPRPGNRRWTSGPYHADATFLALEGNVVRLLRTSGVRTSIPLEKLSPADQQWIRDYLAAQ